MLTSAPAPSFDPPLGRPGTLTDQNEAGHLSLQRRVKAHGGRIDLFDKVHGYGWRLVNFGDSSVGDTLSEESKSFFVDRLGGQCVSVSADEDVSGEYRDWFADDLGADNVVLVRPDFYVFGHAPSSEVDSLVDQLREMMGAA